MRQETSIEQNSDPTIRTYMNGAASLLITDKADFIVEYFRVFNLINVISQFYCILL